MESDPIEVPIDGTLDLHHFQPKEIADLVTEYLSACKLKGIFSVRLVHGKGIGTLREIVHSTLRKNPEVKNFRLADQLGGGWGATLVTLKD
jgi:dsDNA-specific endonuclease/ATPase MutS2